MSLYRWWVFCSPLIGWFCVAMFVFVVAVVVSVFFVVCNVVVTILGFASARVVFGGVFCECESDLSSGARVCVRNNPTVKPLSKLAVFFGKKK